MLALVAVALGAIATLSLAGQRATEPRDYRTLPAITDVPYVWERSANGKQLVVIGTRHLRDPKSSMYKRIERILERTKPQIILHESEVPDSVAAMSREGAIRVGADAGFAVQTAKRYGAETRSGDAPPKEEMKALLQRYPAADVFVFLTVQRLIGTDQPPDWAAAKADYPKFYINKLVANGLPSRPEWFAWEGFLAEYLKVAGKPLAQASWSPDTAKPFRNTGRLSELARGVNVIRDEWLLASMRDALSDHDSVVVIFGGAHLRALEPILESVLP